MSRLFLRLARVAYDGIALTGATMSLSTDATRRLLILCGVVPLSELTQEEVDFLFRRLVEDAPADDPTGPDGPGEPGA